MSTRFWVLPRVALSGNGEFIAWSGPSGLFDRAVSQQRRVNAGRLFRPRLAYWTKGADVKPGRYGIEAIFGYTLSTSYLEK